MVYVNFDVFFYLMFKFSLSNGCVHMHLYHSHQSSGVDFFEISVRVLSNLFVLDLVGLGVSF